MALLRKIYFLEMVIDERFFLSQVREESSPINDNQTVRPRNGPKIDITQDDE